MDPKDMRRRLADAPVGRLATVGSDGRPHLVPVTFALDGDTIVFAVDAKPKRTRNLQRLRNLAANPACSVLVDHYDDDWTGLWWVRADGDGRVLTDPRAIERAVDMLVARYAQYAAGRPSGPVVAIEIHRMSGWSAA